MHGIVVQYFQYLFSTDQSASFTEIMPRVPSKVKEMDNNLLIAQVINAEIEKAIYQMHPTKSLGLDGFNVGFFHHHWEMVRGMVMGMVKSFFQSWQMLKELNHTNIVLIPKVDNLLKMSQFRLISLCNVVYKIILEVLTNRLKRVLSKVVSQNQSTFVEGQQISNNI